MRLKQAKVAGHFAVKNSGWFRLNKQLTIIAGSSGTGKTTILRALQAINPPPVLTDIDPFQDYPTHIQKENYKRKVIPSKKTAAFSVFNCDSSLRQELSKIDPVFHETERIEAGRRLDLSRWITFVEISGSSRWSELALDMEKLKNFAIQNNINPALVEQYEAVTQLKATDRIKGQIAELLSSWLHSIESSLDEQHLRLFQEALFKVERDKRFQDARKLTAKHLPLFVYFSDAFIIHSKIHLKQIGTEQLPDLYAGNNFGNFCFLKMLGLNTEEMPEMSKEQIAKQLPGFQISCDEFCQKINHDWPNLDIKSPVSLEGDTLHISCEDKTTLWLLSLYAILHELAGTNKPSKIILLLDEPGKDFPREDQKQLRKIISNLSKKYQILCATSSVNMINRENLKQVLVAQLIDESTGVTLQHKTTTFEDLEKLLSRA